jgi:hypothetical protein
MNDFVIISRPVSLQTVQSLFCLCFNSNNNTLNAVTSSLVDTYDRTLWKVDKSIVLPPIQGSGSKDVTTLDWDVVTRFPPEPSTLVTQKQPC